MGLGRMIWQKMEPHIKKVTSRKILILGLGKSGTTILTARISKALKVNHLFLEPQSVLGQSDLSLHRHICSRKGKVVSKVLLYPQQPEQLKEIQALYDQVIWIVRDPRDQMISSFLYAWYAAHGVKEDQYHEALSLVRKKEKSPGEVSFRECMTTCFRLDSFFNRYHFVIEKIDAAFNISDADNKFLLIKYEDFIDHKLEELNDFLGFSIDPETQVYQLAKQVNRSQTYGNWRKWFTEEDVLWMQPLLSPILLRMGYDATDWKLESPDSLNPQYGSEYMERMFRYKRSKLDIMKGLIDYY